MTTTVVDSSGEERAEPRGRLAWQVATVTAVRQETPTVKTFTLALPAWRRHRAGQHYDLRLRAADGYEAQRSYSVASPPEREGEIELTLERVTDGEVSTYMHEVVTPGEQVEVRGPFGGYFVWDAGQPEPLLLVAGGSGVVPLMCILRHRSATAKRSPAELLYSARSHDEVIYRAELDALAAADPSLRVDLTLTRSQPRGWTGYARRVDDVILRQIVERLPAHPRVYVCGPTVFVESIAGLLVATGVPPHDVLTERFGPTGLP